MPNALLVTLPMSLAQFPQLQSLPEGALACFVAAQCVPVGMTKGGLATWTERFRRLLSVYRQCRHAFHLLSASITPVGPQADASPSVLMALSSERWPTFREMFPGIIQEDAIDIYGPAATLHRPGKHIAMINRCLSNCDAAFTDAAERCVGRARTLARSEHMSMFLTLSSVYLHHRFVRDTFAEAWWWAELTSTARKQNMEVGRGGTESTPGMGTYGFLSMLSALSAPSATTMASGDPSGPDAASVAAAVQHVAQELLGSHTSPDAPLMEAGLDSLGAVEFRSQLSSHLDNVKLPETLIFDFSTLRQVEAHALDVVGATSAKLLPGPAGKALAQGSALQQLLRQVGALPAVDKAPSTKLGTAECASSALLQAASCQLGGGVHGVRALWATSATAWDAVATVPQHRWDVTVDGRVAYGAFMQVIELLGERKSEAE